MTNLNRSKILYRKKIRSVKFDQNCLVIIDKRVHQLFRHHLENCAVYAVTAGESLKEFVNLNQHLEVIFKKLPVASRKDLCIVGIGGGAVGDFSGFVASILKRGVRLIHVPTTWLAAFDSAHGGKTAMNLRGIKNQIGSFYPAQEIILIREIFEAMPNRLRIEALGEVVKMGIISGGPLWKAMNPGSISSNIKLWSVLPKMIAAKNKIVTQDPFELLGKRIKLNLGHTLGHALETQYQMPHGTAVAYGLRFSLEWSKVLGFLNRPQAEAIELKVGTALPTLSQLCKLTKKTTILQSHLMRDKKVGLGNRIEFIFIKKPGKLLVKKVPIQNIVKVLGKIYE